MGAFVLAAVGGLFTVPSPVAASESPAVFTSQAHAAAKPCDITLPGGLKATVTDTAGGPVARLSDPAKADTGVETYWSGGHQYLIPTSAPGSAGAGSDPSAYDTTALAERACSTADPAAGTARSAHSASGGSYRMARLTVHAEHVALGAATASTLLLANLDDNTYVRQTYSVPHGVLHLAVPVGHYAAMLVVKNLSGDHLTIDPDVVVEDGTDLTLDAATATVPIPVPSTPRPATLTNSSFNVYLGDGAGIGTEHSVWYNAQHISADPLHIWVNPGAGPITRAHFSIVSTFDYVSPENVAEPYAYHVVTSNDRTLNAYPTETDAASFATVQRSYATSAPTGATEMVVYSGAPAWAFHTGVVLATGFDLVASGTTRTEYYSGLPDTAWSYDYEDVQRHVLISSATTTYHEGQRVRETVDAGALHPNGSVAADNVAYCGACSDGTALQFAIFPDADNTPANRGQLYDSESNTVTLKRNGQLYATGDEGLALTAVEVPAGKARYELNLKTERSTPSTPASPSTDTTWTFTADPGHGKPVSGTTLCLDEGDTCAALPLLYAFTNTDADLLNQVTTGRHTLSLHVERQQQAVGGTISGAEASVSYDDGAHWQRLPVHGGSGDFSADYTVPSDASGHTVSFRLSAWDTAGNRIDQELPGAYLVP